MKIIFLRDARLTHKIVGAAAAVAEGGQFTDNPVPFSAGLSTDLPRQLPYKRCNDLLATQ